MAFIYQLYIYFFYDMHSARKEKLSYTVAQTHQVFTINSAEVKY